VVADSIPPIVHLASPVAGHVQGPHPSSLHMDLTKPICGERDSPSLSVYHDVEVCRTAANYFKHEDNGTRFSVGFVTKVDQPYTTISRPWSAQAPATGTQQPSLSTTGSAANSKTNGNNGTTKDAPSPCNTNLTPISRWLHEPSIEQPYQNIFAVQAVSSNDETSAHVQQANKGQVTRSATCTLGKTSGTVH
jgi:hypothetical protein